MENNTQNHQEIDLIYLFKKIKEFIFNIGLILYKAINFIKKNSLILFSLILIGVGIGYLIEKSIFSTQRSELMVIPNFGSTEFLYNEIDILNESKSKIPELNNLVKIKVEPIYEINDLFITKKNNEQKQEFLKTFFENSKNIEQEMTSEKLKSLYKTHLITIETKHKDGTNKTIDYILERLNTNEYFIKKGKNEQIILQNKEKELKKSITQINEILNKIGEKDFTNTNENGVNINTYNEIGTMLNQKNDFITDLSIINDKIIESKSTIFPLDISTNIKKEKQLQNNYKIIFPILFLAFFFVFKFYGYLRNKYHKLV